MLGPASSPRENHQDIYIAQVGDYLVVQRL